jgi:hypothetical protein
MKKRQKDRMKDMMTKTFDQRYKEMSKFEKVGHWFFMTLLLLGLVAMYFLGN